MAGKLSKISAPPAYESTW